MKVRPKWILGQLCLGAVLAALVALLLQVRGARRVESELLKAQAAHSALAAELARAETQLQARLREPAAEAPSAPIPAAEARLPELLRWLADHPDLAIPEIALVPEAFLRDVAMTLRPGSNVDLRDAARSLRSRGREIFGNSARAALARFADTHGGALPLTMADLAPQFDLPVEDAVLRRYQVLARGNYAAAPPKASLLGEVAGVPDDFDTVLSVSRTGIDRPFTDRSTKEIRLALHRYLGAQGGPPPADLAALTPYLGAPLGAEVLAKYTIDESYRAIRKN